MNDVEQVESHAWLSHQIRLTRSIRPLNDSVCSVIYADDGIPSTGGIAPGFFQGKKFISVDHVVDRICIPFPADDKTAFLSDAISFSDWVGSRPECPTDTAPIYWKRLFLSVLMAVQQKDLGTPSFRKKELMKKESLSPLRT